MGPWLTGADEICRCKSRSRGLRARSVAASRALRACGRELPLQVVIARLTGPVGRCKSRSQGLRTGIVAASRDRKAYGSGRSLQIAISRLANRI